MFERCVSVLAGAALFSLLAPAFAQEAMVPVPPNLRVEGVPPIPASLTSNRIAAICAVPNTATSEIRR